MLSIGDGIAIVGGLGAIITVWRLATRRTKDNPGSVPVNGKVVLQRACDTNVEAFNRQLDGLTKLCNDGFAEVRKSIRSVHERVDRALMDRSE